MTTTTMSTCFRCSTPTADCICDYGPNEADRLDYLTPEGWIDPSRIWCPDCGADEWCPQSRVESLAEAMAAPELAIGVATHKGSR